jgi:hypothetical protein
MDNLDISRPPDTARVNIDQMQELGYWTRKWGVTPAQLREAVERVGPSSLAVARALGKPAEPAP